jgi:hypothetical protein
MTVYVAKCIHGMRAEHSSGAILPYIHRSKNEVVPYAAYRLREYLFWFPWMSLTYGMISRTLQAKVEDI